jgi:hypothetical protein
MAPTTTAADEPRPIPSSPCDEFNLSTYLVSFVMAIILYALSPGPVAKALKPRTFIAFITQSTLDRTLQITYAPLNYCRVRSPAVRRFYDWYIDKVWQAE